MVRTVNYYIYSNLLNNVYYPLIIGDGNTYGAHLEVCEIGSCILLSLSDVCRKWKDIGFELGFEKERLEGIERKCGNKPTDCFRAMLAEWWPRNDDGACGYDCCCRCSQMLTLVEALSKPHVGLLHIANEIRKEVCGYTCDHPDAGHSSVSSFAGKGIRIIIAMTCSGSHRE